MKTKTCEDMLYSFRKYFSDQFMIGETEYGCTIMTPFLKADNDLINIYIQDIGGGKLKITDYGDCIFDLERLGYEFNSDRRKDILDRIIRKGDVKIEDKALVLITDIASAPDAIQRVMSAAMDLCSLSYHARAPQINDFSKEVHEYLFLKGIDHEYYERGVQVEYEGVPFLFSMRKPVAREGDLGALIQAMRVEEKGQSSELARRKVFGFLYLQSQNARFSGISVIDNREGLFSKNALRLVERASHKVFEWEEREELQEYLVSGLL